jgi:omega-6 fatty acid desaturase (delta-12 desaturase)
VPTLTVREYLARTPWRRFCYRATREPLILFLVVPVFLLVVAHRLPDREEWQSKVQLVSILGTDVALVALALLLAWLVGVRALLLVEVPILAVFSSVAVWMFFVQHQFEDTYWAPDGNWDYVRAALRGSSYYRLPKILQWFTGNIGLHHIHHLSPRIPNYRLQACHDENPILQDVPIMTIRDSLRTVRLALWDEAEQRLISFAALRRRTAACEA